MSEGQPQLLVEGIVKTYAGAETDRPAVDGVSFQIEHGEFFTLLGPSGCGKTTTLRCVAGLERTDAGLIAIDGKVVSRHRPNVFVRADERDIGMVFQSYAIWPHMTVFDNVAFPLRAARRSRRSVPRADIRYRVTEVLEAVQLDGYARRLASRLSGGQQQRLALARALAARPALLLLDEPLSNLDASLRELMRVELRRLQRSLGVTTLYVTHDQTEALSLSNRVAVMLDGKIMQLSRPRELYRSPQTKFVATFVGRTNLLDGRISPGIPQDNLRLIDTPIGALYLPTPAGVQSLDEVAVSIRPEDLILHRDDPTATRRNVLPGEVEYVLFLGETVEYHIRIGAELLISRQHPSDRYRRRDKIFVEFAADHCTVISDEHGTTYDSTDDAADEESQLDTTATTTSQLRGGDEADLLGPRA